MFEHESKARMLNFTPQTSIPEAYGKVLLLIASGQHFQKLDTGTDRMIL